MSAVAPTLVNSIYPISYFTLPGVTAIDYPDNFWWASKERFAAVDDTGFNYLPIAQGGFRTSEIMELDLGRIREINYINFDCLRAPIDITIEYDAISTPDRTPVWKVARPVVDSTGLNTELPFDDSSSFDPQNKTAWINLEFNFQDEFNQMVHARYFRITFTRRDEAWPTTSSPAFQWPVFVKHLRMGRYISDYLDTVGPLLNQDTPNGLVPLILPQLSPLTTTEARQQFIIPETEVRAGQTPNLLGFGVLVEGNQNPVPGSSERPADVDLDTTLAWSLYDVTATPQKILSGVVGPFSNIDGQTWIDFYLDESQVIIGDTAKTYEFRVQSTNSLACNTVYTHSPNGLTTTSLPGTLTFIQNSAVVSTSVDTTSVLEPNQFIILTEIPDQPLLVSTVTSSQITLEATYPGANAITTGSIVYPLTSWDGSTYTEDASRNLVMRVWADIADSGQDVLGNAYRYVVRRQEAANVFDNNKVGWMSDPKPTPEAVEALYFDVRDIDNTGAFIYRLIEALEIAPRTPGVSMAIYYTQENLHGERPVTTEDWDNLFWQPFEENYTLRGDQIIKLPFPVAAAYMKLEFTALNPLPYRLPSYPPLPPKQYRRYPTWVETQFSNAQLQTVIQGWFLRNATPVEQKVLQQLADPVKEYEYQQAEFLAALALGTITDQQTVSSGLVDIADKALIDPTTGSKIYIQTPDQYGSPLLATVDQSSILGQIVVQNFDTSILTQPTENQNNPAPGTTIPVVSTTNDRLTQAYQSLAQIPMRFYKPSRHIYTVEEAEFNKKAYFVGINKVQWLRIDYGVAYDDPLITESLYDDTLLIEDTWERESETTIPDGATVYVSYQVGEQQINSEQVVLAGFTPTELAVTGGPARNVVVYAMAAEKGIQYFQGLDYQLGYGTDANGARATFMERSPLSVRLSVPLQPTFFQDAFTVIGHGNIPQQIHDAATVHGTGIVTGTNFRALFDAFKVVGRGVVTGTDTKTVTPKYGDGDYGTGTYGDLQ